MKVIGSRVLNMEKEFILFRMAADTKVSIMKIRNTVKVFTIRIKERL